MDTKKILSLLLSIAMVLTLMPVGTLSFAQSRQAAAEVTASLEAAVKLDGTVGIKQTASIKIVLNGATFKDVANNADIQAWFTGAEWIDKGQLEAVVSKDPAPTNELEVAVSFTAREAIDNKPVTITIPEANLESTLTTTGGIEVKTNLLTLNFTQAAPAQASATAALQNADPRLGIVGLVRTTMKEHELKITLQNASFEAMNDGTDVASWVTVEDQKGSVGYQIKGAVSDGANELTIRIYGTPSKKYEEKLEITIPAEGLKDRDQPITITPTDAVKFNFYELEFESNSMIGTIGEVFGSNLTSQNYPLNVVITSSVLAFDTDQVTPEKCLAWFNENIQNSGLTISGELHALSGGTGLENRKLIITFSGTPTKLLNAGKYAITIPKEAFAGGYVFTDYVTQDTEKVFMNIAQGSAAAENGDALEIQGVRGDVLEEKIVKISLTNAAFKELPQGTNVSKWFTNSPNGLAYTIKNSVSDGATEALVAINGRPVAELDAQAEITILAEHLKDRKVGEKTIGSNNKEDVFANLPIQPSDHVVFKVVAPPPARADLLRDYNFSGTNALRVGNSFTHIITLDLHRAEFIDAIAENKDVIGWFQNPPTGMTAVVKSVVKESHKTRVTVELKIDAPVEMAKKDVAIVIPSTDLKNGQSAITVENTKKLTFEIVKNAPSPSPSPAPQNQDNAEQSSSKAAENKADEKSEVKKEGDAALAVVTVNTAGKGTVRANISTAAVESALKAAEKFAQERKHLGINPALEIKLTTDKNAEGASLSLSKTAVDAVAKSKAEALTVSSGIGTVTLDKKAVESVAKNAGGNVALNVEKAEKILNAAQKKAVGDAPVYDITIVSGNRKLTSFDGGLITVEIPYTLKAGQKPSGVVVWYVDELGNIKKVEAMYNVKTQSVIFTTNHLSKYAVAYESSASDEKVDWMNPYSDVAMGAWYYDAVKFVAEKGYMSGHAGMFFPAMDTNRAMVVSVLHRIEGAPAVSSDMGAEPFRDVADGSYYTDAVKWAAAQKIVAGRNDGTFAPELAITRQELAIILKKYAAYKQYAMANETVDLSKFKDADMVSDWAKDAMIWAVSAGIINGKDGDMLDPKGTATRAEIAQMLKLFMEKK